MQFLVAALLGGLMQVMASMVGRVLIALGLSFVVYSGFDVSFTWLLDQIKANFAGMPAEVVSFLAWLWVDKAIGLVFSALTAALALKMAGGTTLTKLVRK